jgi:Secretion system C-terminal sorting domain
MRLRVLTFLVILFIAGFQFNASGQSETNTAGTVSQSGSDISWTNMSVAELALSNDTSGADIVLEEDDESNYLELTNFGFTIPSGATILGIEVTMRAKSEDSSEAESSSRELYLLKNGSRVGQNKNGSWPSDWTTNVYGGSTDLWSVTWTPADINNSNFGISFHVEGEDDAEGGPEDDEESSYFLDFVQIKVYYSTILPITISSFTAQSDQNDIYVNWTTVKELNNDFYLIQRSSDGEHFNAIGKMDGAGTSGNEIAYQYKDQNVASGIYYYRLKQVDFDGGYSYSKIVRIEIKSKADPDFILSPNPYFQGALTIQFNSMEGFSSAVVSIYAMNGQVVYSTLMDTGLNSFTFEPDSTWEKGMYLVHIQLDNNKQLVRKLII